MATTFKLSIQTPEGSAFEGEVQSVTAPGAEGYFGVLAHHAALISTLVPGKLTLRLAEGNLDDYAVSGGFFEVSDNHAMVLADACEHVSAIDVLRARQAEKAARVEMERRRGQASFAQAEMALKRAINRISLGEGRGTG